MLDSLASVGWPSSIASGSAIRSRSPHGIGIAIGFAVGAWLFTRLAVRRGIPQQAADSVVFWSVIGAIVGARVGYVIAHVSSLEPARLVQDLGGRDLLLGGIAGATIANAINIAAGLPVPLLPGRRCDRTLSRARHLGRPDRRPDHRRPPRQADLVAARMDLRGRDARAPVPLRRRAVRGRPPGPVLPDDRSNAGAVLRDAGQVVEQGIGVHQTAMYDMILAGLLFVFLWWFIRSPRREGSTLTFGLAYGASGCSRTRCASTSGSDRSPARSGRR